VNISGEHDWTAAKFPVPAGEHVFKWSYEKDYSVSNGSDCAWLDYIVFPARKVVTGNLMFQATANPLVQINPNPTTDWINISIDWPSAETLQLIIIDQNGRQLFGKQIKEKQLQGFEKIDASHWPSGSYTIIVAGKSQKLAKQLIRF
jgi:hypothetical protein